MPRLALIDGDILAYEAASVSQTKVSFSETETVTEADYEESKKNLPHPGLPPDHRDEGLLGSPE